MEDIVKKYLDDSATEAEKRELLHWLRQKENRRHFVFHRYSWKSGLDKTWFPAGGEEIWNRIQSGLLERSFGEWQKSRKAQQILRYAAIFFFLTTLGVVTWLVTLRTVKADRRLTTIMADNGQISRVELPDGSLAWVNSGSAISYDQFFGLKNRELQLKGEAFFDVRKSDKIPLVVHCEELNMRVTGTKFNVNAFPKENHVSIVLEEGSVELFRKDNSAFLYRMNPGELAFFDLSTRKLTVSAINTHRYTSWKEGIIHLYDQTLTEVAARLTTRYNQKFEISDEVKNYHYTFTIKNESLAEIIGLIEKITPVKAEQHGTLIKFKSARKVAGSMDK